jgi:hypothetical protein
MRVSRSELYCSSIYAITRFFPFPICIAYVVDIEGQSLGKIVEPVQTNFVIQIEHHTLSGIESNKNSGKVLPERVCSAVQSKEGLPGSGKAIRAMAIEKKPFNFLSN